MKRCCSALAIGLLVLLRPLAVTARPDDNVRQPIAWTLSAPQIKANCAREIATARRRTNAIAARGAQADPAALVALEDLQADFNDRTVAETFLFNVSLAADVRTASQACQDDTSAFEAEFAARPDLYRTLLAIKRSGKARSPYQTKLLQLYLESAVRGGAGLNRRDRATFVRLSQQLAKLQSAFTANLANDNTTIAITPAQSVGLEADLVATLTKNPDGSYTVPVNEATVTPFLQNETDPAARKAYYLAFNRRGGTANVKLLEQAIAIRYRLAHLLGFRSWADYQLENKMAQSPSRVIAFLRDLDTRLKVGAGSELAILAQLKAKDTNDPNSRIDPWDYSYYANQLRKTSYAVDQREVKQYFPVQHVVDSVLAINSTLLGVTFSPGADDAWLKAPAVLHYTVTDTATGRYLGDTYFDLYPRAGKYAHFANFPILPNRRVGTRTRAPLSAILGNWPQPAPGKPALLSHGDVETFFHEFGHDMAAMLSTAPYETLSGGFRQDFVEAPSQMLENWVWDPTTLRRLSSRWDTGAPLPDDLIAKLIASRYVNQSLGYTRQAFLALLDMAYHTAPSPNVDTTAVWSSLQATTTLLPFVPGTYPQAGFGHLMGGYDAGYYGYLWSKVYAQDLFTRFVREGLQSADAGAAYRRDILEPASTFEPDQEVRAFLGRPMSPEAFYRDLGLTAPANR